MGRLKWRIISILGRDRESKKWQVASSKLSLRASFFGEAISKTLRETASQKDDTYPAEVLNTTTFIIEECIRGEEYTPSMLDEFVPNRGGEVGFAPAGQAKDEQVLAAIDKISFTDSQ